MGRLKVFTCPKHMFSIFYIVAIIMLLLTIILYGSLVDGYPYLMPPLARVTDIYLVPKSYVNEGPSETGSKATQPQYIDDGHTSAGRPPGAVRP